MKKTFLLTALFLFCSTLIFASKVEGTWNASIDTDNGVFEFSVVYKVDGEKITGEFLTDYGDLEFGPGKINGKEFEYTFEIEYVKNTHKGKLVSDNEILIKYTNENGDSGEFKLKRAPK